MPAAPPTTKPSTPRLSEVARHVVVPPGVTSTGWSRVEAKCSDMGLSFRWWQKPIGQIILAKREDGKYASTIGGTGLSIPRQVGKTFLVGAIIFALCLLRPNLTVIWTAHRLRTAEETFKKMQAFAGRKAIKPFVKKITVGSGDEAIEFHNGSRILFGARERGFGRGFDEVDVVIYDEAQILTENALDDMIPAMNQCRQPEGALLLFMGTPPKPSDPGEVFTRMRAEALSGEDEDTAWVEFGADPGYVPTALPAKLTEADWAQVAKANPSYPDDTPREAILRMRKKLGSDSFLREGMGIWDEFDRNLLFPNWFKLAGDPTMPTTFAIASDVQKKVLRLGCSDGTYVGLITPESFGTELAKIPRSRETEFVAEVARITKARGGAPVGLQERGPAWTLKPALEAVGVRVETVTFGAFVQACADFETAANDGTLRHSDDPELNDAVAAAEWKTVNDQLVLSRKAGDASALEAALIARHVAANVGGFFAARR
jgi:hypothetical protein